MNDSEVKKMEKSQETQTITLTESSEAHDAVDGTASLDIQKPEKVSIVELQSTAIGINSADEVRQAIQAVLTKKASQPQVETAATADTKSKEIQASVIQEYNPESGDQLHITEQNTRKRRGRPLIAGCSKRAKKPVTVDDFYKGKLSNLVSGPIRGLRDSGSDPDVSCSQVVPRPSARKWRKRF